MARRDLLALSGDDLAVLSNRGTVREARAELESGRIHGELSEDAEGGVRVRWSDGPVSEIPAGAALRAGRCSCNRITTCKHLVRLVLLYQSQVETPPAVEAWDPGALSDEELTRHFRPAVLAKARERFAAGILAELVRGTRPVARFHLPVCIVHFLVPGDLRYTRCDCAGPAPCEHVLLAVWAYRLLEPARRAGIVTAGSAVPAVAADLLDAAEQVVLELAEHGISGAGKGWSDRLARVEQRCLEAGLSWPADVLGELRRQQECYATHDARFDPRQVAELAGELAARVDAIRQDTGALPQLLIRGSTDDRPVELGKGSYWGLGCGVRLVGRGVELAVYLYDCKAGGVVVLTRSFAEDEDGDGPRRSFDVLAQRSALRGASFAALGAGVLQIDGGKRTARYELLPGRAPAGVMAQERFAWEEVQAPVLLDDFTELEDRLASLPPSCLRPRRLAEDFHVLPVARVEAARFDNASHCVEALLRDTQEREALLVHPYTTRGRAGALALLGRLSGEGEVLRFVAGSVSRSTAGLVVRPTGLVFAGARGRSALQPWVERHADPIPGEGEVAAKGETHPLASDGVQDFLDILQRELGELFVLGLTRASDPTLRTWRELVRQGEGVGYVRLTGRVGELAQALEQKPHTLHWDAPAAARRLVELAVLARLAQDVA